MALKRIPVLECDRCGSRYREMFPVSLDRLVEDAEANGWRVEWRDANRAQIKSVACRRCYETSLGHPSSV